MQETLIVTGQPTITLRDQNGLVKQHFQIPNLVVNAGKQWVAQRAASNTPNPMSHMAVGSGSLVPGVSDVALGSELARVALQTTTVNVSTITYTATFGAGVGTGTLFEAGIFNPENVMLCRVTFGVVTKEAGDSISISWDVTIN